MDQFAPALSLATGATVEWLRAHNLHGSHIWRKAGGLIGERLKWPERDASLVGEWAPPAAGGAKTAPGGSRRAASVRKRHYTPHYSQEEQLEVRTRLFAAIAAAIALFGVDNITPETGWADLLPATAPPELAPFYGPRPTAAPAPATKAGKPPAAKPRAAKKAKGGAPPSAALSRPTRDTRAPTRHA
jgi:hypothetical protein